MTWAATSDPYWRANDLKTRRWTDKPWIFLACSVDMLMTSTSSSQNPGNFWVDQHTSLYLYFQFWDGKETDLPKTSAPFFCPVKLPRPLTKPPAPCCSLTPMERLLPFMVFVKRQPDFVEVSLFFLLLSYHLDQSSSNTWCQKTGGLLRSYTTCLPSGWFFLFCLTCLPSKFSWHHPI